MRVLLVEDDADLSRQLKGALADAGGDVRFVSYSGMAHLVPPDMMHDDAWRAWLFSQKRKKG